MKKKKKKVALWSVVAIAGIVTIWQVGKAISTKKKKKECESTSGSYDTLGKICIPKAPSTGTTTTSTSTSSNQKPPSSAKADDSKILRYGDGPSVELKEAKEAINDAILYGRNKKIKADPKISTSAQYWQDKAKRLAQVSNLPLLDPKTGYGTGTRTAAMTIFGYTDFDLLQVDVWVKKWFDFVKTHTV